MSARRVRRVRREREAEARFCAACVAGELARRSARGNGEQARRLHEDAHGSNPRQARIEGGICLTKLRGNVREMYYSCGRWCPQLIADAVSASQERFCSLWESGLA